MKNTHSIHIISTLLYSAILCSCVEDDQTQEPISFDPFQPSIDDISTTPHELPYDNNAYGMILINDWSTLEFFAHQDFTEATSYKMNGNFTIENPTYADRLNLFPDLRKLNAHFIVDGEHITNFNGFANLDSIDGILQLKNSPDIQSLEGFSSLNYIGGGLYFYNTDSLITLKGLEQATLEGGNILIQRLDKLISLEYFPQTTAISGTLTIAENGSLQSITGVESLQSVGGNVVINKNGALKNLDGLNGLTHIEGDLRIIDCDALENIDALKNIQSVGGLILFSSNTHAKEWDYSFLPKAPIVI